VQQAAGNNGRRGPTAFGASFIFLLAATMCGCGSSSGTAAPSQGSILLRVGVGNVASGSPAGGLQQVAGNQSFEGLVRFGPDGRPRAWLAKSWNIGAGGRSMTLELRPEAKFHDGSPANASAIAQSLRETLPAFMGPVFADINAVEPSADGHQINISFKQPSPFLLEALEATIKKPGAPTVGTGPFVVAGEGSANEMRSNSDYYLGRPTIDRIVVTSYPTVRAAWADMLRNKIDMLYELSADAAPSMEEATTVSTFTFTRPYQYMVILNVKLPKFQAAEVRRSLNASIDPTEVVREGFDGHATPSSGLVSPRNWAFNESAPTIKYDPQGAAAKLKVGPKLTFTCLVPTDYERVALVVQRQLAAVGVTMNVKPTTANDALRELGNPSFEAVLLDVIDGPTLLRPYEYWHTGGSMNLESFSRPNIDIAFDRIRHAASDDEYRAGVAELQKVTAEDPPAIYLAWGQRSRAISKRFDVPVEAGRDVLSTLRLWKPAAAAQTASRN
jgi:peptide/nickel transport system substrate-binding protein